MPPEITVNEISSKAGKKTWNRVRQIDKKHTKFRNLKQPTKQKLYLIWV